MKPIISFISILIVLNGYSQTRYIHVLVALCDNKNQGIVPVPAKIGNGQDPANNLYWGCGYGVKTFLKKQPEWILIKKFEKPEKYILERVVFKHKDSLVYIVAEAYDGAEIKQTITDFFNFAAGNSKNKIHVDSLTINIGGNADLICYVGHNGLMDFALESYPSKSDTKKREVVVLACASMQYFKSPLKKAGATPLILTTNLMCPEAYTLNTIIESWINNDTPSVTKEKAAQIYNQYQKCGIKGARNLFIN
jgi:hypothetical protein